MTIKVCLTATYQVLRPRGGNEALGFVPASDEEVAMLLESSRAVESLSLQGRYSHPEYGLFVRELVNYNLEAVKEDR